MPRKRVLRPIVSSANVLILIYVKHDQASRPQCKEQAAASGAFREMRPKLLDDVIVSLDNPESAAFWLRELDISMSALQLTISRVGNRYNDVREALGMARVYFFPRDDSTMQRLLNRGLISQ